MTTYSTFLPVFSGFYSNDNYEINYESEIDFIYEQRRENGLLEITDIDLDVDYDRFMGDVSKELCSYIEESFNDFCKTTHIKIEFEKVISPREYNFRNDSINCDIKCDLEILLQICRDNLKLFTNYIKNTYTSRDGFWSSHSNDITDWFNLEYINDNQGHRVGALLNFICTEVYEITEPSLYELDIEDSEYFTNTDYYLTLNIRNDSTICFTDVANYDKGCFWFRTYSSLSSANFEFDNEFRTIQFTDNTERILTELVNSPLIDFTYSLEYCEN